MSPDSMVVANMLKDDDSFGVPRHPDEVIDEKRQKIVSQ